MEALMKSFKLMTVAMVAALICSTQSHAMMQFLRRGQLPKMVSTNFRPQKVQKRFFYDGFPTPKQIGKSSIGLFSIGGLVVGSAAYTYGLYNGKRNIACESKCNEQYKQCMKNCSAVAEKAQ
jgi:hypothetical protein